MENPNGTVQTVGDIIKNSVDSARFSFYRQGYLYYSLDIKDHTTDYDRLGTKTTKYVFPVEVSDLGTATVSEVEKPITMMRYIRKALEAGSFVRASK